MAATTFEGKVAEVLMARVAAIPGSVPAAYPNRDFRPPMDSNGEPLAYMDVAHLPNGTAFETLGASGAIHQGILQIAVMQPEGGGAVKPQDTAGAIVEHFAKNTVLYGDGLNVKIYSRPTVGQSFPGDSYIRTPVTIQYIASA